MLDFHPEGLRCTIAAPLPAGEGAAAVERAAAE
jgi:hypothetical protein